MRFIVVIFVINYISSSSAISCEELLELPENYEFSLGLLKTMSSNDIVQCLPHIGKEELSKDAAEFVWETLVAHHKGVNNIPKKILMNLHWVTTAIALDDYSNLTITDIDVVQNFGLNYNLEETKLDAIADRIREDYAGKEPEDYTYYDLTALKQILCAFNKSEIERIHPVAYRDAALIIGKLKNCNEEVMKGFATLAMQDKAFGPPENWNENVIRVLGSVAEYVPKELIKNDKT